MADKVYDQREELHELKTGLIISRDNYYSRRNMGNVWLCHDRGFVASMIEINGRQIFCTWDQIQDLMHMIQYANGARKVEAEMDAEAAALSRS